MCPAPKEIMLYIFFTTYLPNSCYKYLKLSLGSDLPILHGCISVATTASLPIQEALLSTFVFLQLLQHSALFVICSELADNLVVATLHVQEAGF